MVKLRRVKNTSADRSTIAITGGTYTDDVSKYLDETVVAYVTSKNEDGVEVKTYFTNEGEAVAAAAEDENATVTLLNDNTDCVVLVKVLKSASCTSTGVGRYETADGSKYEYRTIPMTYHTWTEDSPAWEWTVDVKKNTVTATCTWTCADCGSVCAVEATVADEAVTTAATCVDDAYTTYTANATYNNNGKTEMSNDSYDVAASGTATGHKWTVSSDYVTVTPFADYTSATATLKCATCGKATKDADSVEISLDSKTEATCDVNGTAKYTATVWFDLDEDGAKDSDETLSVTNTDTTKATGHDWEPNAYYYGDVDSNGNSLEGEDYSEDGGWVWTAETDAYGNITKYTDATLYLVCQNDINHEVERNTASAKAVTITQKQSVDETTGQVIITYTATYTLNDDETTFTSERTVCQHANKTTVMTGECAESGNGTYTLTTTCDDCGATVDVENADSTSNHVWNINQDAIGWNWDFNESDLKKSTCTVTLTCMCGEETVERDANVTAKTVQGQTAADGTAISCGTTVLTATYTVSSLSNYTITDTVVIGHDWLEATEADYTDPTCTEGGYFTYHCANCQETYKEYVEDALGHTYESTVEEEPTCEEDGQAKYTCTVCGDWYTDTVPATGHFYDYEGGEVAHDATCEEPAYVVKTCQYCGKIVKENVEGSYALGHTSDNETHTKAATCISRGYTYNLCTSCGAELNISYNTTGKDSSNHVGDLEYKTIREATETQSGIVRYYCSACDTTGYKVIPAHAHAYADAIKWSWDETEDGYTATAIRTCTVCDMDDEIAADVTYEVTKEATETTTGVGVYTATVTVDGKTYTDTKEVEIPVKEHEHAYIAGADWDTFDEDTMTVTMALVCTCGDSTEVTADVTSEVITPATATDEGEGLYTATATYEGTVYTDTKPYVIPATGHIHTLESYFDWADDYSTASLVLWCTECDFTDYTLATVTVTMDEEGNTVYTATAFYDGVEYTDVKVVEAEDPGHEHTYGDPTFTWSEDYTTATATFTCTEGDDTQTVEAEVSKKEIATATCTEAGSHDEVVYCIVCHAELSRENIEDPATGVHQWVAAVIDGVKTKVCKHCGIEKP